MSEKMPFPLNSDQAAEMQLAEECTDAMIAALLPIFDRCEPRHVVLALAHIVGQITADQEEPEEWLTSATGKEPYMMKLIIPPASMKLSTGPIDDPFEEDSKEDCPQCSEQLTVQWAQEGLCHSGLFATELLVDVYWCESCEQSFVDEADANDTEANEARKRKSARQVAH